MDRVLQAQLLDTALQSPGAWHLRAMHLRAAAKRLDPYKFPCLDEESALGFLAEYKLLLGLAFEILLKGFVVLHRIDTAQSPVLPNEALTHKLEQLAIRRECSFLQINTDEIQILHHLTPYIEWAGRYPVPKKARDLHPAALPSTEYKEECLLWDRLWAICIDKSWVLKGGYGGATTYRVYFRKRPNT